MKKRISIGLIMIAITIGVSAYSITKEPTKKTDTIITDKNGKIIEPISGENDTIGHQ